MAKTHDASLLSRLRSVPAALVLVSVACGTSDPEGSNTSPTGGSPSSAGSLGHAGASAGSGGKSGDGAGGFGGAPAAGSSGKASSGAGGRSSAGSGGAGRDGGEGGLARGGSSGGSSGAGGAAAGAGAASGVAGLEAGGMANASGGAASNAGAGGRSGAAGESSLAIAAEIHEFRLEAPCVDANHFGSDKQDNCDMAMSVDRQTYEKSIGGDEATIYDVKLHVRGLTEPNIYAGGTLTPPRFYVGGQTTQTGYSAYSLRVADPPQVYYFNYNGSVGHFVFELDYEVVVPMRGGTTVTFDVNAQPSVPDGHGVSNRESVVVEGVEPAPDPFNGQFVQVDVVLVTPRN